MLRYLPFFLDSWQTVFILSFILDWVYVDSFRPVVTSIGNYYRELNGHWRVAVVVGSRRVRSTSVVLVIFSCTTKLISSLAAMFFFTRAGETGAHIFQLSRSRKLYPVNLSSTVLPRSRMNDDTSIIVRLSLCFATYLVKATVVMTSHLTGWLILKEPLLSRSVITMGMDNLTRLIS